MFLNYLELEKFLLEQLPVFTKKPYPIEDFKLDKVIHFLETIGNPHLDFKSIHIAGTNGKGSVSNMLAAVLQEQGFRVGLYTSPHLYDLKERIKINGNNIQENFILDFVNDNLLLIKKLSLSFFELLVVLAFAYFKKEKIDYAVVEVGLGGRLDSTNIITPILSVITNISLEHTQWLGDTVEKIAMEKGGIIKNNVPIIIGEYEKKTGPIFEAQAIEKNAAILFANKTYKILQQSIENNVQEFIIENVASKKQIKIGCDLLGNYQKHNVLTVLTCVDILKSQNIIIEEKKMHDALHEVKTRTQFRGRWDVLHENPLMIADVAHNESGIEQIIHYIAKNNFPKIHFIIGMVKDKNHERIFNLLPKHFLYYFTQADLFRALEKEKLQAMARDYKLQGAIFENVNVAITKALKIADADDLIIICGSLFLIAEINSNFFYEH